MDHLRVREYGSAGPLVAVLHGGPAAPGSMAPVARELAGSFRVIEPWQRGSGGESLTVARHVADLHELLTSRYRNQRLAVVGHSWGAMLALAYAAAHPPDVVALALIGCGCFDPVARDRLRAIRESRIDDRLRRRIDRLPEEIPDADQRLDALGRLMLAIDAYDLVTADDEVELCDARAHRETWEDMLRQQEAGVFPQAFAAIEAPVILLHGAVDPHPGKMIRASLEPYLPRLEYREWDRCGHYPWLERAVRDEFFAVLRDWLAERCRMARGPSPA